MSRLVGYSTPRCPHRSAVNAPRRIRIAKPAPVLDDGRYAVKRTVGDTVAVSADIFRDGHEKMRAVVKYKAPGGRRWLETELHAVDAHHQRRALGGRVHGRDARHAGSSPSRPGPTAGPPGTTSCGARSTADLDEDLSRRDLRGRRAARARAGARKGDAEGLDRVRASRVLGRPRRADARASSTSRSGRSSSTPMEAGPGARRRDRARQADPARGRPRQGPLRRLVRALPALLGRPEGASRRVVPDIADLGFDVLYLLPFHPIGVKNRKGRNNTLVAGPDDPGSPYAIGGAEGGHFDVHPELGTQQDVRDLCATAHQHGMDVALDIALNASADHPWLTEHPEWFQQRPDGTLKYAENPPKRYQDIYNFNWDTPAWESPVAGLARRLPALGRRRDQVLPRRQPAHEAVPVLGVAHQRGPQGRPRRGLPRGVLHAPRRHARAGQARLHAVLHVLHVEELAPRDDRVLQRARVGRGEGVLPAELLPGHAGHPARLPASTAARRRSSRGSCWRPR